ncbi:MAG TPA: hypothetical protein VEY31_06485 [Roseococcus sp.]|nr:hypothetical protein [Roseococcus sp.]
MVKASLALMLVLTVLVSFGLRWREDRMSGGAKPRGWVAAQKHKVNRWVTAAAIAAVGTTVLLGGLHWVKIWQG